MAPLPFSPMVGHPRMGHDLRNSYHGTMTFFKDVSSVTVDILQEQFTENNVDVLSKLGPVDPVALFRQDFFVRWSQSSAPVFLEKYSLEILLESTRR